VSGEIAKRDNDSCRIFIQTQRRRGLRQLHFLDAGSTKSAAAKFAMLSQKGVQDTETVA
jgi:hypothetical protein